MRIYHPDIEKYVDKGWKIAKENKYHVTLEKREEDLVIKLSIETGAIVKGPMKSIEFYYGIKARSR